MVEPQLHYSNSTFLSKELQSICEADDELSQQTWKTSGSDDSKSYRSTPMVGHVPGKNAGLMPSCNIVLDYNSDGSQGFNLKKKKEKGRDGVPCEEVELMQRDVIRQNVRASTIYSAMVKETKATFSRMKSVQHLEDGDVSCVTSISATVSEDDNVSKASSVSFIRKEHVRNQLSTVYSQGELDLILSVSNEARTPEVYRVNRVEVSEIIVSLKVKEFDDNMHVLDVLEGV